MIQRGKAKVESGQSTAHEPNANRCAPAARGASFPFPHSPFPFRRQALTLVELLVSIAIISILATLLLGAAAVAGETARAARTKALVARLHTLVMDRYDAYRTRRIELKAIAKVDSAALRNLLQTQAGWVPPTNPPLKSLAGGGDPRVLAMARLVGMRELMKLEMPDRWSDVVGWNNSGVNPPADSLPLPQVMQADVQNRLWVLNTVPTLTSIYLRQYQQMEDNNVLTEVARENQSAECLYLFVMNGTGDGAARSLFKDGDIGDTDDDGAMEFVDGWGRPISFIRWAPAFDSDAQLSYESLRRTLNKKGANAVVDLIEGDHDPYDLFRVDQPNASGLSGPDGHLNGRAWRLVPLIYSAGGDEESGVADLPEQVTELNPYNPLLPEPRLGGAEDFELTADNITNHDVAALSRSN